MDFDSNPVSMDPMSVRPARLNISHKFCEAVHIFDIRLKYWFFWFRVGQDIKILWSGANYNSVNWHDILFRDGTARDVNGNSTVSNFSLAW